MSSLEASPRRISRRLPRRTRSGRVLKVGLVIVLIALIGLVAVPVISPEIGSFMADGLRSIVGPEPVAAIESLSFKIQDAFNRLQYDLSGGQPQIAWADLPTVAPAPTLTSSAFVVISPTQSSGSPVATPTITPTPTPPPTSNVVDAPPQGDMQWQAFGPSVAGQPVMARTSVKPDASRPYAQAALIRIDLAQVQLHVVPGTVEPIAATGVSAFPRPGAIPLDVQTSGNLLAAFNGGFKAVHGGYGMMIDSNQVTIRPPLDNIATVALYQDGHVRIGAWGRDITATADLIAYRQNCPLLIDAGQINPDVSNGSRKEWGYTIQNLDTTWRSGLGLSRDGRFLIYAVGNSLTVESLAWALQQAGAYYAMQLDINGFYTRFVTYDMTGTKTKGYVATAHKLLSQMVGDATQFLRPYKRDFFYVTASHM
jgi:hypothetical protein